MKDAFGWIERVIPTRTLEDNILAIKFALTIIGQNLRKLDSDRVSFLESILTPSTGVDPAVFYQIIQDQAGTAQVQRPILAFDGFIVGDDPANNRTIVSHTYVGIQDEGVDITPAPILDFQGAGVTVIPGLGNIIITIPGGGGGGSGDSFLEWAL